MTRPRMSQRESREHNRGLPQQGREVIRFITSLAIELIGAADELGMERERDKSKMTLSFHGGSEDQWWGGGGGHD